MPSTPTTSKMMTTTYLLVVLGLAFVTAGLGIEGRIGILFGLLGVGCCIAAIVTGIRADRERKQASGDKR